jgi:hypothetical protein
MQLFASVQLHRTLMFSAIIVNVVDTQKQLLSFSAAGALVSAICTIDNIPYGIPPVDVFGIHLRFERSQLVSIHFGEPFSPANLLPSIHVIPKFPQILCIQLRTTFVVSLQRVRIAASGTPVINSLGREVFNGLALATPAASRVCHQAFPSQGLARCRLVHTESVQEFHRIHNVFQCTLQYKAADS